MRGSEVGARVRGHKPPFDLRNQLFLATAILTMVIVALAFSMHQDHEAYTAYCQASAHAQEEGCKLQGAPFVARFLNDPTALFTGVLTLFTGLLFLATCGLWYMAAAQARDMKESISAARQSADAAIRQLTHVERPYLFIFNLSPFQADPETAELFVTYSVGNFRQNARYHRQAVYRFRLQRNR